MATGFAPFAVNRNIPPGDNDPAIVPRAAILHVDAGNASSLFDFFKNRSGGIESHFFVTLTGKIEQYRSIYRQADANLDANDFAVSIETQGFGSGKWNILQRRAIKKLLLWLNEEAGIPLRKIQRWDGSGIGYHTLFGSPSHWTPVAKSCPGPDRIKQFEAWLVPWMHIALNPKATLRLVTFNVWVGQHGWKLRRNLRRMSKDAGLPRLIALQEAHGLKRGFRRYERFAADGYPRKEASNCVLLVRRDTRFVRRLILAIKGPHWEGKRHGQIHPPRVFFGGVVEVEGTRWDILGLHRATSNDGKNRATRAAEAEQTIEWVGIRHGHHPSRPIVLVGDFNGIPVAIAHAIGAGMALDDIDGALFINAHCLSIHTLPGKYGSDNHNPVVIDLEEN